MFIFLDQYGSLVAFILFLIIAGVIFAKFYFINSKHKLKIKEVEDCTKFSDKCSLLYIDNNGITYTKEGIPCIIIELRGKDYTGLSNEDVDGLFYGRKTFFDNLPDDITILHQSHRFQIQQQIETSYFSIEAARVIAQKWGKKFKKSYRTRHYIVIFSETKNIVDKITKNVAALSSKNEIYEEQLKSVVNTSENLLLLLSQYNARILKDDEVATYWAWLANGTPMRQKRPLHGFVEGILCETIFEFPMENYYVTRNKQEKFRAILVAKESPLAQETRASLVNKLFTCKIDFSFFQTYSKVEKSKAKKDAEDRLQNAIGFKKYSETRIVELQELLIQIEADDLSLISHRWYIEIAGNSQKELDDNVSTVANLFAGYGIRTYRETINKEACFWSRFPGMHNFNARKRSITSQNAAHFSTFASIGEGLNRCAWGNQPVCMFKTTKGSDYNFTFHDSESKDALGNTLVIGGSESGKTTLVEFLLSNCFKYEGFRAILFDSHKGTKVWNQFHDGVFIDSENKNSLRFNPFKLADTPENKVFLSTLICSLIGNSSDESKDVASEAIKLNYAVTKDKRTLDNISPAFRMQPIDDRKHVQGIEHWLTGGMYEGFFTSETDAFDLSSPLISIDMTVLLNNPDVLTPIALYIFHCITQMAKDKDTGYVMFVDEGPSYMKSEIFKQNITRILREIRKTIGVCIFASQQLGPLVEDPSLGEFLNNIATYIIFPDPRAKWEHYGDKGLGLNRAQFDWIRHSSPTARQCMIFRRSGEVVILDVNLNHLGSYKKMMDSSKTAILKCDMLQKEYGSNWKRIYFNEN